MRMIKLKNLDSDIIASVMSCLFHKETTKSLFDIRITRFVKSPEKHRQKSELAEAKSRRKFSFAVLPKQSALV